MLKLIVVSGIPGTGKSSVAESVATSLRLPILSIDPIEAAMWHGGFPKDATGVAAYEVAAATAEEQLKLELSVVIDAVNPVESSRDTWRRLAARRHAKLIPIEIICSEESLHRQRVEKRKRNIPGMPEVTWERVLERRQEYEPWADKHLTLDSVAPLSNLVQRALDYINES